MKANKLKLSMEHKESLNESNQLDQDADSQILSIKELKAKKSEICIKTNNHPKIEQDFRRICALYEKSAFDLSINQAYQEYADAYHRITTIYHIREIDEKTILYSYDTENEHEQHRTLAISEQLTSSSCITRLPNGELFCLGKYPLSGVAVIIYHDRVRMLPPGKPISGSSAVYFNRNVYCFGGSSEDGTSLSSKFDLERNRWINLVSLPKDNYLCYSIVFNGNILVSGYYIRNIWQYSIEINSFSTIPYKFSYGLRKILINFERLYLIECGSNGLIYESHVENEYFWEKIANSIITSVPSQVFCSYNKGGIYIKIKSGSEYYKFDLDRKIMIKFNDVI